MIERASRLYDLIERMASCGHEGHQFHWQMVEAYEMASEAASLNLDWNLPQNRR